MSTILEALRRSEQERKLNDIPTLSNMRAPQEASRWPAIGLMIMGLLLLALVAFLASNWFSGRGLLGPGSSDQTMPDVPVAVTNETVGVPDVAKPSEESKDIVVNVVSYSDQAEQRFAMINGKLFREGEFVRGGLKVEKILPDEVVLVSRGRRIVRKP